MREKFLGYLTTKHILLLLFFVGLIIQWPIYTFLHIEYSLIEVFLLIICAVWFLRSSNDDPTRPINRRDPLVRVILVWALWAFFLWIISTDWTYNLNEIRWLFLSVGAVIILLEISRNDWQAVLWTFLGVAVLAALIGDIQGLAGIQPPFSALTSKDIYLSPDQYVDQSVAVGFFRHPNAFGGFVFWPLLILAGMLPKRQYRFLAIAGMIFFGSSLYLSYYRTLLLGLAYALFVFALIRSRLSPRWVGLAILGTTVLGIIGIVFLLNLFPTISFFSNLWFRIRLWQHCLAFIQNEPLILLFGAGFTPSAALMQSSARSDPHNAFFYMLMHYGLPGLLLFVVLIWMVIQKGWQAYRDGVFAREPILAALWAGWIAWFVTDFADSRLTTPEWQMLFIFILALYWGRLACLKNRSETEDPISVYQNRIPPGR
jgi:hypothetical protein